jgi:hypothetical protein
MTDLTVVLGVIEFAKQYLDFSSSDNFRQDIPDERVTDFSHSLFPVLADRQRILYRPSEIIAIEQYQEPILQEYVQSLMKTLSLRNLLLKRPTNQQEVIFNTICWSKLLKNVISTGKFIEDAHLDGLMDLIDKLKGSLQSWLTNTDQVEDIRRRKFTEAQVQETKIFFGHFLKQLHHLRPAAVQTLHEFLYIANRMIREQRELSPSKSTDLDSMAMLVSPCILDALQLRGKIHTQMAHEFYFFGQVVRSVIQIEIFQKRYQPKYYGLSILPPTPSLSSSSSSSSSSVEMSSLLPKIEGLYLTRSSADVLSPRGLERSPRLLFSVKHPVSPQEDESEFIATRPRAAAAPMAGSSFESKTHKKDKKDNKSKKTRSTSVSFIGEGESKSISSDSRHLDTPRQLDRDRIIQQPSAASGSKFKN